MSQANEINLTLDEKNGILDKILRFQKQNVLRDIRCRVIDGIDHYEGNLLDTNGTKIEFLCSAYRDYEPKHGRFGLKKVGIAIGWDKYMTFIESGGGSVYDKIKELIDYLKPICDQQNGASKSLLLY